MISTSPKPRINNNRGIRSPLGPINQNENVFNSIESGTILKKQHSPGKVLVSIDGSPVSEDVISYMEDFDKDKQELIDINKELTSQLKLKEGEVDKLTSDFLGMKNRLNAVQTEHREIRSRWTSDKSDLEQKVFQTMGLVTHTQATLKKKEKDYDKLQDQLQKIARTNNRSQKGCITISRPLAKNSSQSKTTSGIGLKDAEVYAAQQLVQEFEQENQTLRGALTELTTEVVSLRAQLGDVTSAVNDIQTVQSAFATKMPPTPVTNRKDKRNNNINNNSNSSSSSSSMRSPIPMTNITITDNNTNTPPPSSSVLKSKINFKDDENTTFSALSPLPMLKTPGMLRRQERLEGTPSARPVEWVIDQVTSEMNKLRTRFTKLDENQQKVAAWAQTAKKRSTSVATNRKKKLSESQIIDRDNQRDLREKQLSKQLAKAHLSLTEAIQVIRSQDALMSKALKAQLPTEEEHLEHGDSHGNGIMRRGDQYGEHEDEDENKGHLRKIDCWKLENSNQNSIDNNSYDNNKINNKMKSEDKDNVAYEEAVHTESDVEAAVADIADINSLLPPTSPETELLLTEAGILPINLNKKDF